MKLPNWMKRGAPEVEKLTCRSFSLHSERGGPKTIDRETRSLQVVAATENPVEVLDMTRWEIVPEILLMDGARLPKSRKIPLLDSHSRYQVGAVLGSARALRVEKNQLIADTHFATSRRADEAFKLVAEEHIEDFSIGYRVNRHTWIDAGKTKTVKGRLYAGPLRVVTDWTPRELSVVPIGADDAAKARSISEEGDNEMKKELLAYLQMRGLPEDATEEQAWAFLAELRVKDGERQPGEQRQDPPKPVPVPAPPEPDPPPGANPEQIRQDATRAEQSRIIEIRALCDRFNFPEMAGDLISSGRSIQEAQQAVLEKLNKRDEVTPGYRGLVEIGVDAGEKFRAAAVDSLLVRAGFSMEKHAPGARELSQFTMRELARECLRISGQSIGGTVLDMVGRAMMTTDFPHILAASANKSLFEGWEAARETWSDWCSTGSLPDFKLANIVRASEFDDLDEIPEAAEYKYGDRTEGKETVQIVTYGKMFAITRQLIINDDLGMLTDIPAGHGEAAARKIGDLPYAVLDANAVMGDGIPLFDALHGNLGTAGVVSITTIAEAIKLMGLQKDIGGKRRLNIRPQYFLGPRSIEGAAEVFFKSMQYAASAVAGTPDEAWATTRANPYAGSYFQRIYDARLDDDSLTAWYLLGPRGKTVRVFFLNGVQRPYLEQRTGWSVDGIEYKVRIDAAAKAVDWRGLVKNAGA